MILYICGIIVMEPTTLPITVVLEDPENVFRMGEIEEKERKLLTTEITIDGNPLEGKRLVVGEQSVKELTKLLEHKNFFVRRDAVRALGKLGTPEAIAAVIEHFESEKNELVKRWAVIVLGRSGTKDAIPALKAEFNPKSKRGAFTLSTDIFWALIKLEAEGIESAGAFGGYVKRFIYHLSHEYRKVDYKSLSNEERMAFLKRAADEFEARYLKETSDASSSIPGAELSEIDFKEVDRLIEQLDSDKGEQRDAAKEKLITIGRKSALHAETLGPYLLKCSEQEKSVHVRACLSEILNTLSSVSVSLIRSEMKSSYGPRVPSLRQAIIISIIRLVPEICVTPS